LLGGEQQRAKQNYIGRPERRENPVGESADQECYFRADEISHRDEKRRRNGFLESTQENKSARSGRRNRTKEQGVVHAAGPMPCRPSSPSYNYCYYYLSFIVPRPVYDSALR